MMSSKRILTVNNVRSLLMDVVKGLLEGNGNGKFEVVSILADDLADLIREVEQVKPNIIIIEEASTFITPAELITSLPHMQNLRLVVLNAQTNQLNIYDKNELTVSSLDHFMETLNYRAPS